MCEQCKTDRAVPLLVLVLHVQKYKPLHCSQHAGGVSGQRAEKTVEIRLILFLFLLSFLFPFSLLQNRSVALDIILLFTDHLST